MIGGLLLLLLLESTVSAAANCGPRSIPVIVGTTAAASSLTALDVEGFGDSARVTGDLTSWA